MPSVPAVLGFRERPSLALAGSGRSSQTLAFLFSSKEPVRKAAKRLGFNQVLTFHLFAVQKCD